MIKIVKHIVVITSLAIMSGLYAESDVYNLDKVYDEVKLNSLDLHALSEKKLANDAALEQSKVYANPEVEIGLENLGIDEFEIGVSQTIELKKKRAARISAVAKAQLSNNLEAEKITRKLEAETLRRMIPLVKIKQQLQLTDSIISIAHSSEEVIRARIAAGAAMEIDLLRLQIEREKLIIEKNNLLAEFRIAEDNLTSHMNLPQNRNISYDLPLFSSDYTIPAISFFEASLSRTFDVRECDLRVEELLAEQKEAETEILPDLKFSAGYKRNNEASTNSLLLGFGMDIPIFNNNKALSKEKDHLMRSVKLEKRNSLQNITAELNKMYSEINLLQQNLTSLKTNIMPKTVQVYELLEEYYAASRISIFEVIEARKELAEIKMAVIEKQAEFAILSSDLFELTGKKINIFNVK